MVDLQSRGEHPATDWIRARINDCAEGPWSGSTGISNKRSRTSLEGWTFDPDLYKPGINSFR